MQSLYVILAILGVAAIMFVGVKMAQAHARRERERLAGLDAWGRLNGFTFTKDDPYELHQVFHQVADMGRGHARYAFEVLRRDEPAPTYLFGYHFKTWETRTVRRGNRTVTQRYEQTHWRRYLICVLSVPFPELLIRTEGFFDKLAGFVGFDDIDFESEEFSRRYFCKSADKQFAYAIIHPQMMEWLMTQPFAAALDRGMILMDLTGRRHDAADCHAAIAQLAGFVNRIPPFVWEDYARRMPITLPEPTPDVAPLTTTTPTSSHGIPAQAV